MGDGGTIGPITMDVNEPGRTQDHRSATPGPARQWMETPESDHAHPYPPEPGAFCASYPVDHGHCLRPISLQDEVGVVDGAAQDTLEDKAVGAVSDFRVTPHLLDNQIRGLT